MYFRLQLGERHHANYSTVQPRAGMSRDPYIVIYCPKREDEWREGIVSNHVTRLAD
jgi:hypothetical protein